LKIAYFVNEYPKVSHSFIRREIQALERQGIVVARFALRGWSGPLPDEEDLKERGRTSYVLQGSLWSLLLPTLLIAVQTPLRFLAALLQAVKMFRNSDRPLPYHLFYLAEACRTLPWIRAAGACHIHAHFGTNSADIAMLIHLLGGPRYSFTVHGPEEFMRPVGLAEKIRHATFTIAVSSFGRSQLYFGAKYADWPKIKVVHCGLDRSFYADAPTTVNTSARLVCVGRLTEAKGQTLLIQAAARLATRGIAFDIVLAGDGPMRPQLESMIHHHGLVDRVRITGWLSSDAVREEFLAARALVLPSFAEGLPVVIMEAMALRRPVLTTYVAGIPELVQHGATGWLFPAGSVEDLSSAIEDCLATSAEQLQRFGDAAYERVIARHSIDIEAHKLADHFRSADHQP
jgi:glycosyltransferase involved in cell wall biosynthesis